MSLILLAISNHGSLLCRTMNIGSKLELCGSCTSADRLSPYITIGTILSLEMASLTTKKSMVLTRHIVPELNDKWTVMERLAFLPYIVILYVAPFSAHFLLKYQTMFVHDYCPFFCS
jgi:hypothetical protein